MPTQKPYTFAIHTSQSLTKNYKRVCLANAPKEMKIVANLKKNNYISERMPVGNNIYKALGDKWLN